MSGWHDVLDTQIDLLHFWRSEKGALAAEGYGASMAATEAEVGHLGGVWLARHLRELQVYGLLRADPFYVDAEMMKLVDVAAEMFQPETLQETDFLTESAFVVFPAPLYIIDRSGKRLAFRAVLWDKVVLTNEAERARVPGVAVPAPDSGLGVLLSLYSHIDDDDDLMIEYSAEQRAEIERLAGSPWSLLHTTPWAFGEEYPANPDQGLVSFWKPLQAFLRLALQTVSERYQQKPPRASARRWQRVKGRPNEDRYITVVRLRRPRSHKEGEPHTVDWKQRWIVGGHWRNQYFPSLHLHRQIWIGAFVKGPSDKPLLVRRGRAFELVK